MGTFSFLWSNFTNIEWALSRGGAKHINITLCSYISYSLSQSKEKTDLEALKLIIDQDSEVEEDVHKDEDHIEIRI